MLDKRTIFEIHRLKNQEWSQRRIAQELRVGRTTVKKYLENPEQTFPQRAPRPSKLDPYPRPSKLDNFRDLADQLIKDNPAVTAKFLQHSLGMEGFSGKIGILSDYLRKRRLQVLSNNCREMNLDMIRGKLYRCMIKGISYLDVLRGSFWKDPNMKQPRLSEEERQAVIRNGLQGDHKTWRYAVAVDMSGLGFGTRRISKILDISRGTIRRVIKAHMEQGLSGIPRKKPHPKKAQERSELKRKRVIEILHQKPRSFRINRSNWSQPSIASAYKEMYGEPISTSTIGDLIRKSGYSIRKARRVLTSADPDYIEKVELLLAKLRSLKPDEMFFFIDEIGPMQVKKYGGRTYVKRGEINNIPQIQNSKGTIISSAALSATTNQLTWLFGKSKDTSSMMDLIEILFDQHQEKTKLFITWDAASWHSSRNLVDWLDKFNNKTKETGKGPLIEFIPLPNRSQFLNVIEAVFSGMKRAVIHHSNYQSEDEMKAAISRHFQERNDYFKANPKRAGKKIWEIDFFQNYDNLRSGNYREW